MGARFAPAPPTPPLPLLLGRLAPPLREVLGLLPAPPPGEEGEVVDVWMWGRGGLSPSVTLLLSMLKAALWTEGSSPLDVPGRLLGRRGEGEGDCERDVLGWLVPNPSPTPDDSGLAS